MDFVDTVAANFIGRVLSEIALKGAPKLYKKLKEIYCASKWQNPFYKLLIGGYAVMLGFSAYLMWLTASSLAGVISFTQIFFVYPIMGIMILLMLLVTRIIKQDVKDYDIVASMRRGTAKIELAKCISCS